MIDRHAFWDGAVDPFPGVAVGFFHATTESDASVPVLGDAACPDEAVALALGACHETLFWGGVMGPSCAWVSVFLPPGVVHRAPTARLRRLLTLSDGALLSNVLRVTLPGGVFESPVSLGSLVVHVAVAAGVEWFFAAVNGACTIRPSLSPSHIR